MFHLVPFFESKTVQLTEQGMIRSHLTTDDATSSLRKNPQSCARQCNLDRDCLVEYAACIRLYRGLEGRHQMLLHFSKAASTERRREPSSQSNEHLPTYSFTSEGHPDEANGRAMYQVQALAGQSVRHCYLIGDTNPGACRPRYSMKQPEAPSISSRSNSIFLRHARTTKWLGYSTLAYVTAERLKSMQLLFLTRAATELMHNSMLDSAIYKAAEWTTDVSPSARMTHDDQAC